MLIKFPPPKKFNYIYGTDQQDHLYSTSASDIIIAGDGHDFLYSGDGADYLYGGKGDDQYWIKDSDDHAVEYANEGTDYVNSYVSYTLGANIENLTLWGGQAINGTGNDLDNHLFGNSGNNILKGGDGQDYIDGNKGADTMYGGIGDDQFVVDNVGDVVVELADEGYDEVISSINFSLVGTDVEQLLLKSGAGAINGTGNDLDNCLSGNESDNVLKGGDGRDLFYGHGGKDTMYGGTGYDYFVVDSTDDVVVEFAGEGEDEIYTTVNYIMSNNVERMYMAGANAIFGWGNGQDNTIWGSSADNSIYGFGGNDTLHGGVGYDMISGGIGNDTMYGDSGEDTFRFYAGFGQDIIGDFRANGDHDVIEFDHNVFADFNAVQAHMTQNGNDVVITLDANNSITLQNLNVGSLQSLDFSFF